MLPRSGLFRFYTADDAAHHLGLLAVMRPGDDARRRTWFRGLPIEIILVGDGKEQGVNATERVGVGGGDGPDGRFAGQVGG